MQISVVQGDYLVLNIVGDIQYETIVRVVWPPQLQLVEVDRDQVSFRLGFKVNFLSFFLMRNKKFFCPKFYFHFLQNWCFDEIECLMSLSHCLMCSFLPLSCFSGEERRLPGRLPHRLWTPLVGHLKHSFSLLKIFPAFLHHLLLSPNLQQTYVLKTGLQLCNNYIRPFVS